MRKVKLLHVFVLSFFISFFTVSPVSACTPWPPTPWFIEKFELLNEKTPDGIIFEQFDWDDVPYSVYAIRNVSEKKVQIIGIDGKVIKETTEKLVMLLSDYPDYYENGYVIEAKNVMADNRPEFVPIPDSQYIEIPVKIDDEFFLLEIFITYELNDLYSPTSVHDYRNACSIIYYDPPFLSIFPYFAIGIIITIVVFALIRMRAKRLQETKK